MHKIQLYFGLLVLALCLTLGATTLSTATNAGPVPSAQTAATADLTPGALDARQFLPLIQRGPTTPGGPVTIQAPAVASWRLFSTGSSYAEGLAGSNLLVDGPGYPFIEVGQYHTHWDQYYVEKGFLAFDTAAVIAPVVSATLTIPTCSVVESDSPFTVEFYPAQIGPTVTPADWSAYGEPQAGAFPVSACGPDESVEIELDPRSVVPGGVTRYAVLTDRIRLGREPERDGGDIVQFATLNPSAALRVRFGGQP